MITRQLKEVLKSNWGDKSDALDCYAEVKLIDHLTNWQCYIYAMDKDESTIDCFVYTQTWGGQLMRWTIEEALSVYNEEGEHPVLDEEYRRTRISELVRRLGHG